MSTPSGASQGPKPIMQWVNDPSEHTPAADSLPGTGDVPVRAGDAEREAAREVLHAALVGGYLDLEEFEERVDHVTQAKTQGQIDGVLDDLPNHVHVTTGDQVDAVARQAADAFGDAGDDSVAETAAAVMSRNTPSYAASALPRSATARDLGIMPNTLLYRVAEAGRVGGQAPVISHGIIVNAETPSEFVRALREVGKGRDVAKTTSVAFAVVFAVIGLMAVIAASPAIIPASIGTVIIGGLFSHSVAKEVISYKYNISGADERLYDQLAELPPEKRQIALGYVYQTRPVENPPTLGDLTSEAVSHMRSRRAEAQRAKAVKKGGKKKRRGGSGVL